MTEKKPPAKKAVKKAPAKRAQSARKAPAKKAAAKKAPAKKATPRKRAPKLSLVPEFAGPNDPPEDADAAAIDAEPHPEEVLDAEVVNEGPADADINALAEELDPAYQAWKLRRKGLTWPQIARQTVYGTAGSAHMAVITWMRHAAVQQSMEVRQEALQLSMDRHEAVVEAFWDKAMEEKDVNAAAVVLRALGQIDKIQRNGEAEQTGLTVERTIVIAGSPEEYLGMLQDVMQERARAIEAPKVDSPADDAP